MESYDVVVVGAGPAGASAAAKASSLGLRTLLIDKRREVGVPVQCGEYLPSEDEMKRMFPDSSHTSTLIELTKAFKQNECDTVRFITPSGTQYDLEFHAYVIDREGFNKELVRAAERSGCETMLRTVCLIGDMGKNEIVVERNCYRKSISFKVLIAADGYSSRIAKSIGLKATRREDEAFTIHSIMDEVEVDARVCEMYWNREYSPGGYAWIIPKNGSVVNVGLGVRRKHFFGDEMIGYLKKFISSDPEASKILGEGRVLSTFGGAVPVGGPIPKTHYENVLIVGDAAGQVAAHVGGGVPSSVICGEIAGEKAYHRIEEGAPLSEYEKAWRREVGAMLEKSLKLRRIGDFFIGDNKLIDLAFNAIGEEGLNRLIRCDFPRKLEALLSKASTMKKAVEKIRLLTSILQ